MITIYRSSQSNPIWTPDLDLQWILQGYALTDDAHSATHVPIQVHSDPHVQRQQETLYRSLPDHLEPILCSFFVIDDDWDIEPWIVQKLAQYAWCEPKVTHYLHTNHNPHTARTGQHCDLLWNRAKAYYTEFSDSLRGLWWAKHSGRRMFDLDPIPSTKHSSTVCLAPFRIYQDALINLAPRMLLRDSLKTIVWGNPRVIHSGSEFIPSQQNSKHLEMERNGNSSIWHPIHNDVYARTYFSAYVETLTGQGSTRSITEKTWDPLIKGHFVLPFGYRGIIDDIRNRGFQLPDFIDYSYDTEVTRSDRWNAYERELRRLIALPNWAELYSNSVDILHHNRQQFYDQKYSTVEL